MQSRRLLMILLLSLSVISIFSTTQAQPISLPADSTGRATIELLANPGFEFDADEDNLPDGWIGKNTDIPSADKQKCDKPEKVFANTGDCAFMFKANASGQSSKLQQTLADTSAILTGTTLTLSAFVDPRSGVPDSKIASVKVKLSDESKLKLELRLPATSASGYTQLTDTLDVTLPAGVSITEVTVDVRYSGASGKVLVDDASLTVMTAAPLPAFQLIGSDSTVDDNFGWSVSLSDDGSTALVGAIYDDVGANVDQGSAYVFVHTGMTWTQQAQLLATDGAANDTFGNAVSLSADGNIALVGAYTDTVDDSEFQGSAYVFVRTGTTWTQHAQLLATDGAFPDKFGWSVDLSADGKTAVIGAANDQVGTNVAQGSAYIFARSGSSWTQQAQLLAGDGDEFDLFGRSVSLSDDGNTALISTPSTKVGESEYQGSAYLFTRNGTTWTQQHQFLAEDSSAYDSFGFASRLSPDGSTALIGVVSDDIGDAANEDQGSAYLFTGTGSTWMQQEKFLASDNAEQDNFGWSVDLSADNGVLLIGSVNDDVDTAVNQGSAYVFTNSDTGWTSRQLLATDAVENDGFGFTVSLSADGRTALVGAANDDVGTNTNQGSVWVFDL